MEDDSEVRNLIFNRLIMNADTSDYELKSEVMEVYGQRYPDMKKDTLLAKLLMANKTPADWFEYQRQNCER